MAEHYLPAHYHRRSLEKAQPTLCEHEHEGAASIVMECMLAH
jgi:hypothetical protein